MRRSGHDGELEVGLEVIHDDASDTVEEKLLCDVGLRYRRPTDAKAVRDALPDGPHHSGECAEAACDVDDRVSDAGTDLSSEYILN